MIERFVELAQKHAPELEVTMFATGVMVKGAGMSNAEFTITLLEYLKGLAVPFRYIVENEKSLPRPFPAELKAPLRAWNLLRQPWHDLTPEALLQACIDVWEVMEWGGCR